MRSIAGRFTSRRTVPLLDGSGVPIGVLGIGHDITERKRTEDELREYRDHLEELVARRTEALSVAKEAAEAASRAKSAFLAKMSHEIRTPLNGVVAMADALARSDLGPREREMVDIVRSSSDTLERLLSDILDTAKIESGQVTIEPAPFHLANVVRETAALWRPKAEEKGVVLAIEIPAEAERQVYGDVVRIRQIVTNLVSNALKFTAQGEVRLSIEDVAGDRVRFTVTDTGVGFEPDQKARIFGRFHQADGLITRRFGGTGLGLAICRRLVELQGGRIGVRSRPGGRRLQRRTDLLCTDCPARHPAGSRAAWR